MSSWGFIMADMLAHVRNSGRCQCNDPVILEPKGGGKCIQCRRPYTQAQADLYAADVARRQLLQDTVTNFRNVARNANLSGLSYMEIHELFLEASTKERDLAKFTQHPPRAGSAEVRTGLQPRRDIQAVQLAPEVRSGDDSGGDAGDSRGYVHASHLGRDVI